MVCLTKPSLRPNAPQSASGVINDDGSIYVTFDAVEGAQSYLVHYGDANQSDPKQAVKMGYTESASWKLAADDVPALVAGDKIYLYVQAYYQTGEGESEIEKAQYLHDGYFAGSAWSDRVAVRFPLPKTPLTLTVDGQEVTGEYEVQEITQADYLILLANEMYNPDIVYSVIPEGSD